MHATAPPTSGNRSDGPAPRKASPLRLAFRIIRWSTYAAAIITLLMVFHAVPPPVIATNPQDTARVEQKSKLSNKPWPVVNPPRFASIRPN